jgi:hypothetical protein
LATPILRQRKFIRTLLISSFVKCTKSSTADSNIRRHLMLYSL